MYYLLKLYTEHNTTSIHKLYGSLDEALQAKEKDKGYRYEENKVKYVFIVKEAPFQ